MSALMQLKILLPYTTFAEKNDVQRIVAETNRGSFGILPNRLDCSAVLTSGIFCYQCKDSPEVFVAVDQGVLVKTGLQVMVSARRAIGQASLEQLHAVVKQEFQVIDEQERQIQQMKIKLETGFLRQLTDFRHQ
jgi:F-type H+-transporting ATPase subunit epsilon